MKFFLSINWNYINIDEVYKVDHDHDETIYSYFYMKNGEKYDVYDMPDEFNIDDDVVYVPCALCHVIINGIVLLMINDYHKTGDILDISKQDEHIWDLFIVWARNNRSKLTRKDGLK